MRRNSLTWSIILTTTAIVTIFWLVGAGFAAWNIREELNEAFDAGLEETARRNVPLSVGYLLAQDQPSSVVTTPRLSDDADDEYLMYQIRDETGKVLLRSYDADSTPFPAPLRRGFWEDDDYRYYTESTIGNGFYIQVAEPMAHRVEAWTESAGALLPPLVILIPASILALAVCIRRGMRPLDRLQAEISRRGDGNLDAIHLEQSPIELESIVNALNRLMARLQSALSAERAFAANSAHELRTPIASALAQTQRLILEIAEGDPARTRGRKVEAALQRLGRLSEKLLQLSRAEAGVSMSETEQDLAPALALVLDDFQRDPSHANRMTSKLDDGDRLTGHMDPDAFAICIRNLIENALLHGSREEPVQVWVTDGKSVHIANGGPTLPPAVLGEIKGRFKRHSASAEGSGLGLAIVDTIISNAGGTLVLLSPRPGRKDGFEAVLKLPQAKAG